MARYDRYDRWRYTPAFTGWYPGAFWAGGPMYGWDGMGAGLPPYVGARGFGAYDRNYRPPRAPRESPLYGRGGDRALQRWAQEHGYDAGYAIPPLPAPDRPYAPPYDRGYGQRYAPRPGPRYDEPFRRGYDEHPGQGYQRSFHRWW